MTGWWLNIPTDGGPEGVTVVNQRGIDLLINRQAACISTLTYNEYWQVIDAGFRPEDLVVSSIPTRVYRRWRTASMRAVIA